MKTFLFGGLLTLVSLLTFPPLLAAQDAPRHKVRVTDAAERAQLVAHGAKLIADYGSYQLFEAAPTEALPKAEVRDDYDFVMLNAGSIDTAQPAGKARRQKLAAFTGHRMHLVQFAGPIRPEWLDELKKTGVKVVDYIPNNTYLVFGNAAALTALQTWAGTAAFVQWEAPYSRDDKISPRARGAQPDWFKIQLHDDGAGNVATLALVDQLKLAPLKKNEHARSFVNLTVRLNAADRDQIAAQPDVISVHPYVEPQPFCERQAQIIAGNLTGIGPTGPGYLAWLASKGFTQAQFDASGFVVDVSDSGIDNGTTAPNHFGLYVSGTRPGTSRVAYARLEGTPNAGSTVQGCDGHGNLNSHIIAGFDDLAGFPYADTNGFHYGLGICPFVKVGSSVVFDTGTFTSPNYNNLMSEAYRDGARVSNNSWGANTAGAYDSDAQSYDALVRDAQPAGASVPNAGNQGMVIVFAAGNAGSGASTVGSPGTAKNVIVVGAGENFQAFGGSDGSGVADSGANNAYDIINFSSRGPCADGRKKPDICAPGTHVSGGAPQVAAPGNLGTANACFNGSGVSGGTGGSHFYPAGQQFYTASSGTSHSTPGVAGACALVRQYFINTYGVPPTPAMTKAFLMNSTRYMTGVGANDTLPSNSQGMGGMNLGMAFDGTSRVLRDQIDADRFTASGQSRSYTGAVVDGSKPFRVTVAWTDAPGPTSGSAYVNDLDLTVTIGGNTYKGNVFSGANSTTGGTADFRDNVESVFLPAGVTGPFTVTITAVTIAGDGVPGNADPLDQDFALVIYNGQQVPTPLILGNGATLTSESCVAGNGAIDPNEVVTVDFALKNTGTANASNVVATLLATGGVTSPSGAQTYGLLVTNGASVVNSFTFTGSGTCGGALTATLQLQDGTNSLGTAVFNFTLGSTGIIFSENFDGVTAPALPAGWTTANGGGQSAWVTSTTQRDTLPNAVFSTDASTTGSNALTSPLIAIASANAKVSFRNNYSLETSGGNYYDGGVLEIKIGAGAFQDILTAGGTFTANGYNATLTSTGTNPFKGRQAWSGSSGGWLTSAANLPASAAGQNIQLRWRCGTDSSVSKPGWYIDTIVVSDAICCNGSAAPAQLVTPGSYNFGTLTTGQTSNALFSVINTGSGLLTGSVATVSPFSVTGGSPYSVSAGQTGLVTVSFAPGSASSFNANVIFTGNAGVSTSIVAGVAVTPPVLGVSPASFAFGTITTGTTAQTTFVVTNTGGATLTGTASVPLPFSILSGSSYTVAGFGSSNVVVRFSPTNAGSFATNVIFISTGGNATNPVTGTGAIVPLAGFTATPSTGAAPLLVTFTDTSTGTITNRSWTFGDAASSNTTLTSVTHSYTAGTYTVRLVVNGPVGVSTNTQNNLVLAQTPPQLTVTPGSFNFGTIATGATAQTSFTVTNSGQATLSGTATAGGAFVVTSASSYSIPGNRSTNIVVSFAPATVASFATNVVFTSNGGNATNAVSGNGALILLASFTATPTNGVAPLPVAFIDNSAGSITNRFWDFGDGVTSNTLLTMINHTYLTIQTNIVKLIITGPLGSNTASTFIVVRPVDSIGDGISDAWRTNFFGGNGTTTNSQSCATCDPDGDGFSNYQEFLAGTAPTSSMSALRVALIGVAGTNLKIDFTSVAGKFYDLEWSGNPDGSSPTIVSNNIPGTGGTVEIIDSGAAIQPQRFYRIRLLP